jgi:hypothetical protein
MQLRFQLHAELESRAQVLADLQPLDGDASIGVSRRAVLSWLLLGEVGQDAFDVDVLALEVRVLGWQGAQR